jgi:mycoredoxin
MTNPESITVYGHAACPMVRPVLHALDAANVPYEYVDIRRDDGEGRVIVRNINNGNESVPTLVFPDGSTLTEPSLGTLSKKLSQAGYSGESLESVGAQLGFTLRNPAYLFTLLAMAIIILAILFTR